MGLTDALERFVGPTQGIWLSFHSLDCTGSKDGQGARGRPRPADSRQTNRRCLELEHTPPLPMVMNMNSAEFALVVVDPAAKNQETEPSRLRAPTENRLSVAQNTSRFADRNAWLSILTFRCSQMICWTKTLETMRREAHVVSG